MNIFDRTVDLITSWSWDGKEEFSGRVAEFVTPTEEGERICQENPDLEKDLDA